MTWPSSDASSARSSSAASSTAGKYELLSAERAAAFVEYEKAARRALRRLRVDRRPA